LNPLSSERTLIFLEEILCIKFEFSIRLLPIIEFPCFFRKYIGLQLIKFLNFFSFTIFFNELFYIMYQFIKLIKFHNNIMEIKG